MCYHSVYQIKNEVNFMSEKQSCYAEIIRDEVSDVSVGETMKPDLHGESLSKFRMTLAHIAKKSNRSFKTKTAIDGSLWIKRTA